MQQILCSTGAVIGRPNGRDFTLLRSCVERLECDGYEFMMYEAWYGKEEALCDFLTHLGVPFPVFHVEKSVGNLISRNQPGDVEKALDLFGANCALAKALSADRLVLHLWGGLDSDKDIAHNIGCYPMLQSISCSHGLDLMVENVVCNCADPMTHLLALAQAYPKVQFTFDTKMAAFHGQMDLLYAEENRHLFPHIRHIHLNDYAGGYMEWGKLQTLHVGDGNVDFPKLFHFLKRMQYQGDYTVEATSFDGTGKIYYEDLNRTFRKIREYLA